MQEKKDIPAFFSCRLSSCHGAFMRSLRAIHSSACSCTGIDSHLFSIFLRVGFEMAVLEARIWLEAAVVVVCVAPLTILLVVGIRNMTTQRGGFLVDGISGDGQASTAVFFFFFRKKSIWKDGPH